MRAILVIIICVVGVAAAPTTDIKVDQVGYLPQARKLAFVVTNQTVSEFLLRKADDSSIVFRGRLSAARGDVDSGDQIQLADFSQFKTEGRFYVEVPGVGTSWSFSIDASRVYLSGRVVAP